MTRGFCSRCRCRQRDRYRVNGGGGCRCGSAAPLGQQQGQRLGHVPRLVRARHAADADPPPDAPPEARCPGAAAGAVEPHQEAARRLEREGAAVNRRDPVERGDLAPRVSRSPRSVSSIRYRDACRTRSASQSAAAPAAARTARQGSAAPAAENASQTSSAPSATSIAMPAVRRSGDGARTASGGASEAVIGAPYSRAPHASRAPVARPAHAEGSGRAPRTLRAPVGAPGALALRRVGGRRGPRRIGQPRVRGGCRGPRRMRGCGRERLSRPAPLVRAESLGRAETTAPRSG